MIPELSFRQTPAEQMVRTAASLLFRALPKAGCNVVPLSSVAEEPQYGFTASAVGEPVGPKFVRITDLKDGSIDWNSVPYCECQETAKYLLKKGDILFARTGATTGKTHHVESDADAVFASYLIRLRPRQGTRSEYLYAFFQSDLYWEQIIAEKEGSAQPNVNGRKLMTVLIPTVDVSLQEQIVDFLKVVRRRQDGAQIDLPLLPPPLGAQRQVVERLECAASRFDVLAALRSQVRAEIDALPLAFAGELFSSTHHWSTRSLGEIADIKAGVTLGRSLTGNTILLPYLRVANVQAGHLDLREVKRVEVLPGEKEIWKLMPGDILLTEGGDWDKLGRGAVWNGEIPDCIHQNHIFRLRLDSERFDPNFVAAQIAAPLGKAYFQAASKQTTNLASINQRQLKAFPVLCPSLTEQRAIVKRLSAFHDKANQLQRIALNLADEVRALRLSVFNHYSSGSQ